MPKVIAYTLAWLDEQKTYALLHTSEEISIQIVPESPGWFEWLEQVSSFVFAGKMGRYTLRKESRQRGDLYWYAYCSGGKQLAKRYVGRTADLTLARLEALGEALVNPQSQGQSPLARARDTTGSGESFAPLTPAESVLIPSSPLLRSEPVQTKGDFLLATKLRVPRQRAQAVPRARLFARLEQSLVGALTLVSAPAGFGKTTLLAQWLAGRGGPAAWLSLAAEDNQPTRFFVYLIAALQKLDPEIGRASLPPLRSHQPPVLEGILAVLTNEIAASEVDPLLVVLDDYHVISDEAIHNAILFLIEHLAPQLHLVLLTRADPLLPLARLRARGQLAELRAGDLRFDLAEAGQFLREVMHIPVTAAELSVLEQRTEGWVAGLQLAALSLRDKQDIPAFLQAFSGSNRFVLDYLGYEVLAHQPEHVLTFLLHTCLLERFCAPLCSALLREDAGYSEGACQELLEHLEKTNLFVYPLDDEQCWYRYHQLFATVLQARLAQTSPELVPALHLRASHWLEAHGYIHEAVHHALIIQDAARLVEVIQPVVWDLLAQGELEALQNWLQRLPDEAERTQPLLCLYHAAALALPGQALAAERYLRYAEEAVQAGQIMPVGEIAAVRTAIEMTKGNPARAAVSAEVARATLPEEQGFLCSLVAGLQAFISAINGDFRAAVQCLLAANAIPQRINNAFTVQRTMSAFAFLLLHLGQLDQAIATCQGLLQRSPTAREKALPFAGFLCLVHLVRLWLLQGDVESLERLERFYAIDEQICSAPGCPYALQTDARGLAYLRYGQGRSQSVEALLRWPLEDAEQNGRVTSVVRMFALQSVAYAQMERLEDALTMLTKAIQAGEPERYINAFAELGQPMAELLHILFVRERARPSATISLPYLQDLLQALGLETELLPALSSPAPSLFEALTEREMDVLQLMGTGLSNAEIARRMVVEMSTVKWHIHHIYAKLQVSTRTQAILRAQELRLLA